MEGDEKGQAGGHKEEYMEDEEEKDQNWKKRREDMHEGISKKIRRIRRIRRRSRIGKG